MKGLFSPMPDFTTTRDAGRIATSDYHTATVVYAVQKALLALDGEEA